MNADTIKLTLPDRSTKEVAYGEKASSLLKFLNAPLEEIFAVKINNKVYTLDKRIKYNAKIEPVLKDSKEGIAIYRRSLCFLLAFAARKLFPNARLLVGHSLGSGYYYTLDTGKDFDEEHVKALQKEMKKLVEEDLPITSRFI